MSMLARYKKKGEAGLMELVKLVEDSSGAKRDQLMAMVRNEDAAYAEAVEGRILTFEAFKTIPENMLAEIVAATPPKFVALALYGESAEFVKLAERCLGKNFNDYKNEKLTLEAAPPAPTQVESGQRKMMAEARKLEAAGQVKLPGSVGVPAPTGAGTTSSTPATNIGNMASAAVPGAVSEGKASADDPCPEIESFGIEAPVPGLTGERFETFLKGQLGVK